MYIILELFCVIFRTILCFKLLFTLLFSIYVWVWLFDVFCRILGLFTQYLTLILMYFDSPWMLLSFYAHGREEEQKNWVQASTTVSTW